MRFLIGIGLSSAAAVLFSGTVRAASRPTCPERVPLKNVSDLFSLCGKFHRMFYHKDKEVITSTMTDIDFEKIEWEKYNNGRIIC